MQIKNYMKSIFILVVFSSVFFIIGCFESHHNNTSYVLNPKYLINNLEVSSESEINQSFGELQIQIVKNSLENGNISITKSQAKILNEDTFTNNNTFSNIPDLNAFYRNKNCDLKKYEIVSQNEYNIRLQNKSLAPMVLSNPAKITFNIDNNYPQTKYYALKKSNNQNFLLKPIHSTKSSLTFETFSFSDWTLIKQDNETTNLNPIITSPSIIVANEDSGRFLNDLSIQICAPYHNQGKYSLKLFSRNIFPFAYENKSFSASKTYDINLMTVKFPEIDSELATFSFKMNLSDYNKNDFPSFIVLSAEYTDPINNSTYITQKKISFETSKNNQENAINTNPYVCDSNPNNSIGVPCIDKNTIITVLFSESMEKKSVSEALKIIPSPLEPIDLSWSDDAKSLKIKTSYAAFESYCLTIDKKAKSTNNIQLQTPFILYFETPKDKAESIPPLIEPSQKTYVRKTEPSDYSENIKLSEKILFSFSNNINKESIKNSISVTPNIEGELTINWINDYTLEVAATKNWSPNTSYRLLLSSNIEDINQQKITDFEYHFKTTNFPLLTSVIPSNQENNIKLDSAIELRFSKPMNSFNTEKSISISPSNNLSFIWETNQYLKIFNSESWQENSNIRLLITNGATDDQLIPLANPQSVVFKTILVPDIIEAQCQPQNNATYVAPETRITIVFNKNINQESAEKAFSLRKDNSSVNISGIFNWIENTMIFIPDTPLENSTKYNVSINSDYIDLDGNKPIKPTNLSFTTAKIEGENWKILFNQNESELSFIPRTEHSMFEFNNSIWIVGGKSNTGNPLKDVFKSSDGITWTKVTDNPEFCARYGHQCVVYKNKIWLSGGITIDSDGISYLNDVWNSDDGIHWNQISEVKETYNLTSDTIFSKRAFHNMLAYKDKLWVMMGESEEGLIGDIWCSTDGVTWTDKSNIEFPRKKSAAIVFNDSSDQNYESIYIIGGYGKDDNNQDLALNDLIVFKDKYTNWQRKETSLSIKGRFGSAITQFNNRIWLLNGNTKTENSPEYSDEILASNNGIDWISITPSSSFKARALHQAISFNNYIIISGGESSDSIFNEIWSFK